MSKLQERRIAQRQKAQHPPHQMVTTREASIRTGIPVRTIQRWATKENRVGWKRRGPKILLVSLADVIEIAKTLKPGKKGSD